MRAKMVLLGAAAGLFLSLGAGTVQADRRGDCWKKVNKAENNLRKAIRNHGPYSRKAQNRRAELRRVQSRCGGFGWNRGRNDNWWGRDRRDRNRDDWRWRDRDRRDDRWNRGRRDNTWNRGNRTRPISWFWSRDGRRHRHSSNGAWCNVRH